MRIQVSYRDAVAKIDACLKEASDLYDFIATDFLEKYDLAEEEKKKKEDAKSERIASLDPLTQAAINVVSNMGMESISHRVTVSQDHIKLYEKKYDEWFQFSLARLRRIFVDYTPIFEFEVAKRDREPYSVGLYGPSAQFRKHDDLLDLLSGKMRTLVEFYKHLSGYVRTPLHYIPEKTEIWFYDVAFSLTADSNEAHLADFMFDFGIGEWKEIRDVIDFVFGEAFEVKNVNSKILNLVNEINRKSNATFGFPILKSHDKKKIALTLPPKFVVGGL